MARQPKKQTVQVRLTAALVGDETINAGTVIDVDAAEAERLIAIGAAVAVE